jgi:hypothetical protein
MTLLDTYLPVYQFREFHQVSVQTAPADLLDAVNLPGILDDPWVKRFIRLRETPGRLLSALGRRSLLKDKAAFGLSDFTRLGRDLDREVAFGLVGKFWQFDYGLVSMVDGRAFERFGIIGVPKLVLNLGRCGGACSGESQMPPRSRRDRRIAITESVRILKHFRAIQPCQKNRARGADEISNGKR